MYTDIEGTDGMPERPQRHTRPQRDRLLLFRNILNAIFMLGAIVGVVYYLVADQYTGTLIILGAMAFKIAESTLRLLRR